MVQEIYVNKLKAQIGKVLASAKADNYFPLVGDVVRIDAGMKWAQSTEWQMKDGSGQTFSSSGTIVNQKDSKTVTIAAPGELPQKLIARNYLTQSIVTKILYAMLPQVLPYFEVEAREIVRVGESGYIHVSPDNGYTKSLSAVTVVRLYRENETTSPVREIDVITGRPTPEGMIVFQYSFDSASDRGIYDVEVDVTDTETGVTFSKRINKLITIVPALCPKPSDTSTGYEVASTYKAQTTYAGVRTFELRLWRNVNESGLNYAEAIIPKGIGGGGYDRIPLGGLPGGTTLVLKSDAQEPNAYSHRLLVQGNVSSDESSASGTANFTYNSPLVITHDNEAVWQWRWLSYGAVNLAHNCRNIVLDGGGYHNTGIHFVPFDTKEFFNSSMFLTGGTSDFEIFNCDLDGSGFAGISAKSDPNVNQPWYWRESGYEFKNLRIHHCTFHNMEGEGVYIGYYGNGKMTGINNAGETVTFHPHIVRGLRIYRCNFDNNGFDAIQINNGCEVEVCHCGITRSGTRRAGGQNSAFSGAFDGKIYNCKVTDIYGPISAFMFPFLEGLVIYNNIFVAPKNTGCFLITAWKSDNEYIDPDDDKMNDTIFMHFYNNIFKGHTFGSFNTDVSFSQFRMNDNLFITEQGTTTLPGTFTGTGNLFMKASTNYDEIDNYLKVADSANYNYQPNYDSRLVSAGKNAYTMYDMRGYKRWYSETSHVGPFMGVIVDPDQVDSSLYLEKILINGGSASTGVREVTVTLAYTGTPSKYRIGETADLSGASWQNWPAGEITYTLSAGYGNKTIYVQIANEEKVSSVRSESIIYSEVVVINDAEAKRVVLVRMDKDKDGEISAAEAVAPTVFDDGWFKGNTVVEDLSCLAQLTGLTASRSSWFQNCTNLKKVHFPAQLVLPTFVCDGCTSLSEVMLPPNPTGEFPAAAFKNCSALASITLPEGYTKINNEAFMGTAIKQVKIPNSVTDLTGFQNCLQLKLVDIGTGITMVRAFTGSINIQTVIVRAGAVPSTWGNPFDASLNNVLNVYVPDNLVSSYQAHANWKNYNIRRLSEYIEQA